MPAKPRVKTAAASTRVSVKPALYEWACARNRLSVVAAAARFPRLPDWIAGDEQPTLRQLEAFASAMRAPIGFFFGESPPEERVPIRDFRTVAGKPVGRPSADLLETIYTCQQRQEWYREFAPTMGETAVLFVGSAKVTDEVVTIAANMRAALGFDPAVRRGLRTWEDALRHFVAQADEAGVMVMCSGIVGNNTRRKLDPDEFRGFTLVDQLAPLVFVNGADTKSAQMFTLAHELAHVWLGETGLSNENVARQPADKIERWCDSVAAEFLVPLAAFAAEYVPTRELATELPRLARIFKVSTLVILRRMHDAGGLTREELWSAYESEMARLRVVRAGGGGNFYLTTAARVSKRFARALIVSTWEGRSSFTEAFRLLGMKKMDSFRGFSDSLGMTV